MSRSIILIAMTAFGLLSPRMAVYARPPTVDPTYGKEIVTLPPDGSNPQKSDAPTAKWIWTTGVAGWPENKGVNYLSHLEIYPKAAQAIPGAGQIAGEETIVNPGKGHLSVTPVTTDSGLKPVLVLDFGQELVGQLQVWGTEGVALSVTTGESREECDHKEPKLNNNGPFDLTMAGVEPAWTPYTAFRYAKLTFSAAVPAEITRIVCDHKYYPVQYRGTFDCSDPLLTRVWYTGAYTAHLCMQEDIWDAPKRDRGLWIGDLQVTGQTINTVFADRFLMEQSIAKVRRKPSTGGRRPSCRRRM